MAAALQDTVQTISPAEFRELITSRRRLTRRVDPVTREWVLVDPETSEMFVTDFAALDKMLMSAE